jgi:hypothetical protein
MPYQVTYDDQEAIVRVTVQGSIGHNAHRAARAEAVRLCREHECRRLMVDLRDMTCSPEASTLSCFDFGSGYQSAGLPAGTRISHVMPQDPQAFERVDLTTTVALNRGVAIHNFSTLQEAEDWLLEHKA